MLAGDWYISDDPDSWEQFKRAVRLRARYTAAHAEDPDAARPILEGPTAPGGVAAVISGTCRTTSCQRHSASPSAGIPALRDSVHA